MQKIILYKKIVLSLVGLCIISFAKSASTAIVGTSSNRKESNKYPIYWGKGQWLFKDTWFGYKWTKFINSNEPGIVITKMQEKVDLMGNALKNEKIKLAKIKSKIDEENIDLSEITKDLASLNELENKNKIASLKKKEKSKTKKINNLNRDLNLQQNKTNLLEELYNVEAKNLKDMSDRDQSLSVSDINNTTTIVTKEISDNKK